MKIAPLDSTNRLFVVEDLLPSALVEHLSTICWLDLPCSKQPGQESWSRRLITADNNAVLGTINLYVQNLLVQLSEQTGVTFTGCSTSWWVDEPGFTVPLHTDGELPSSMQMFWVAPGTEFGTTFYNYKNTNDIKHQFEFKPNTGYIMLNMPNLDGSQPLQWHGMLNPVPNNTVRVTSYTTFGRYENK